MLVIVLQLINLKKSVTIQMKAIEQHFPVVLFIMLYNVFLTFESVDENSLKYDNLDVDSY